jgi:hypothetical protein
MSGWPAPTVAVGGASPLISWLAYLSAASYLSCSRMPTLAALCDLPNLALRKVPAYK